jgi:hypothetical protein
MKSKNQKLLKAFAYFCEWHPELRFWQALNIWSGLPNIVVMNIKGKVAKDTFYFEKRNG